MQYVQYGCGFSVGRGWRNFDSSPTLRLERVPIFGQVLGRLSGNSQRFPLEVEYGDIVAGLPVESGKIKGLYASHILEHLAYDDFKIALRHSYELLAPGGTFRLIVPDLHERARRYLDAAMQGSPDASSDFMRLCHVGLERSPRGVVGAMRRMLGSSVHLWMWDEASMAKHLSEAGFVEVRRCRFGDSEDLAFLEVEDATRFVDPTLHIVELAMSAKKPESNK